ncbi:unnamed protein product [Rotaria sp. Silwood1]|nr:unnamed protein product [Rotaria sp. Silwood1]
MNIFYERFDSYINKLDIKKRNKYTIKDEMYLNITNVLKQEDVNASAKFKFWTRRSFRLMEIGSSHLIYNIKNNLPLITYEKIYEKINECHIAVGHSGRDKTWAEVLILIVLPLNNNTTLHRHSVLSPIELAWSGLKNYIRDNNTNFRLADIHNLALEYLAAVDESLATSYFKHIKRYEDTFKDADKYVQDVIEPKLDDADDDNQVSDDDETSSDDDDQASDDDANSDVQLDDSDN